MEHDAYVAEAPLHGLSIVEQRPQFEAIMRTCFREVALRVRDTEMLSSRHRRRDIDLVHLSHQRSTRFRVKQMWELCE